MHMAHKHTHTLTLTHTHTHTPHHKKGGRSAGEKSRDCAIDVPTRACLRNGLKPMRGDPRRRRRIIYLIIYFPALPFLKSKVSSRYTSPGTVPCESPVTRANGETWLNFTASTSSNHNLELELQRSAHSSRLCLENARLCVYVSVCVCGHASY